MRIWIAILALALLAGCHVTPSPELRELKSVEIQEYEGERLSSIGDFRENSIRGPQFIDINDYTLEVSGLVETPKSYAYDEVIAHQKYSKGTTVHCVEGWSVTLLWEGVLLKDLFEETGIKEGANTVIFHAHDGYTTSLPLDYILDNNIMIAYKQNNVTLPPENGFPFQLVAEDKYGIKWIKWITKIQLSNNTEFRGYWESKGYSNTADINGSVYER